MKPGLDEQRVDPTSGKEPPDQEQADRSQADPEDGDGGAIDGPNRRPAQCLPAHPLSPSVSENPRVKSSRRDDVGFEGGEQFGEVLV